MEEHEYSARNMRQMALYDENGGRALDLSRRALQRLPATLYVMADLHSLDISENPLGELPRELAKLTQMRRLTALQCEVTSFPTQALGIQLFRGF